MKTAGEILKKQRLNKRISLKTAEKKLKIKKEYLEALEEGRYQDLPSAAYIQGFIKNYCQVLNLDSKPILAIFRRDYRLVKKPLFFIGQTKDFSWTPRLTFIISATLILLSFFGYLFWQYRLLLTSPYRP